MNTIATPAASAAAITSASRSDPPGWITAVAPASTAGNETVGEGEERVGGDDRADRRRATRRTAASSAFRAATRAESTRDIWPAPTPTVAPSFT